MKTNFDLNFDYLYRLGAWSKGVAQYITQCEKCKGIRISSNGRHDPKCPSNCGETVKEQVVEWHEDNKYTITNL